ncbi:PREDICTED: carbohydrate sulfotransferase 7 [Ficedula albicollis]|uniref:carbohydrate sulfotransferase 7 n=1 Tax=Ficedula albicollis TaxID=59894 RepID=UPI0003593D53|nr:PREDICTED: carbohydrate sulfotransferase 7 [Ficedula albicollis]
MKGRRRWRGEHRRFAAVLVLYTLLLLLLVPYALDYGARRGRVDEEPLLRRCPSLEEALSEWGWEQRPPLDEEEEEDEAGTAGAAGNGSAGKRHIYLHATWRTGSSFLGELFNQHPDVFYLYEPMWHLWQALYPGDALSLQGALRDMLRALFRCDFSVLRLYTAPSGPRDPLAPPPPQPQHRAEFFLGGALEVICQSWLRDLLLARRAPDWLRRRYTQLRYEDLVREPRAELRRLLRFAGLTVPPALEDFVLNMTRGAAYSSDRPFLISARDAREAVHAWRERLSRQQVRQVEAACGEAMSILAYPLSAGDAR